MIRPFDDLGVSSDPYWPTICDNNKKQSLWSKASSAYSYYSPHVTRELTCIVKDFIAGSIIGMAAEGGVPIELVTTTVAVIGITAIVRGCTQTCWENASLKDKTLVAFLPTIFVVQGMVIMNTAFDWKNILLTDKLSAIPKEIITIRGLAAVTKAAQTIRTTMETSGRVTRPNRHNSKYQKHNQIAKKFIEALPVAFISAGFGIYTAQSMTTPIIAGAVTSMATGVTAKALQSIRSTFF